MNKIRFYFLIIQLVALMFICPALHAQWERINTPTTYLNALGISQEGDNIVALTDNGVYISFDVGESQTHNLSTDYTYNLILLKDSHIYLVSTYGVDKYKLGEKNYTSINSGLPFVSGKIDMKNIFIFDNNIYLQNKNDEIYVKDETDSWNLVTIRSNTILHIAETQDALWAMSRDSLFRKNAGEENWVSLENIVSNEYIIAGNGDVLIRKDIPTSMHYEKLYDLFTDNENVYLMAWSDFSRTVYIELENGDYGGSFVENYPLYYIIKSNDNGNTWTSVSTPTGIYSHANNRLLLHNDIIYRIESSNRNLYEYKFNPALSLHTPENITNKISTAVNAVNRLSIANNELYAATDRGFFNLDLADKSWNDVGIKAYVDLNKFISHNQQLYALTNQGLFLSENHGESWQALIADTREPNSQILNMYFSDQKIWLGTQGEIFTSMNEGETWEQTDYPEITGIRTMNLRNGKLILGAQNRTYITNNEGELISELKTSDDKSRGSAIIYPASIGLITIDDGGQIYKLNEDDLYLENIGSVYRGTAINYYQDMIELDGNLYLSELLGFMRAKPNDLSSNGWYSDNYPFSGRFQANQFYNDGFDLWASTTDLGVLKTNVTGRSNSFLIWEKWNDGIELIDSLTHIGSSTIAVHDSYMYAGNKSLGMIKRKLNDTSGDKQLDKKHTRIYPNPSNGIIKIEGVSIGSQIQIIDFTGQTLYNAPINSKNYQLNLDKLLKGIYLLRLTDRNGSEVVERLVLE